MLRHPQVNIQSMILPRLPDAMNTLVIQQDGNW